MQVEAGLVLLIFLVMCAQSHTAEAPGLWAAHGGGNVPAQPHSCAWQCSRFANPLYSSLIRGEAYKWWQYNTPRLVLRGGGKKQKRNARSRADVLEELARSSLCISGVRSRKSTEDAAVVRTGPMNHQYDSFVESVAGVFTGGDRVGGQRASSFGRAAGEAGRQQFRKQQEARQQWQHVRAPRKRRYRVIIDGSNVLKHGGGAPRVGNLVNLGVCERGLSRQAQSELQASSSSLAHVSPCLLYDSAPHGLQSYARPSALGSTRSMHQLLVRARART